jgi:hypothetical protein
MTGHGDAGCLDLASREPTALGRLETEFPERDVSTAKGLAAVPAFLLLAVLCSLRLKHDLSPAP